MKFYYLIFLMFSTAPIVHSQNTDFHKKQIILVLDQWHEAAANTDFNKKNINYIMKNMGRLKVSSKQQSAK